MPGIFREREAAKGSEYSKSDDFKKLSVLAQILSSYMIKMCIISKETAKRLRKTSHSC